MFSVCDDERTSSAAFEDVVKCIRGTCGCTSKIAQSMKFLPLQFKQLTQLLLTTGSMEEQIIFSTASKGDLSDACSMSCKLLSFPK